MTDFRWPPLDEQSALALTGAVYKARTLLDLRIEPLRYFDLVAHCRRHGDFSITYAEDELLHLEAGDNLAPRLPCPSDESVEPMNLHTATHFRLVRSPYANRGE